MAEEKTKSVSLAARGFGALPVARQVGILLGLAASIAVGIAVGLWTDDVNMRPLYAGLADTDIAAVTDALQKAGIRYEVANNGSVLVPADQVYAARLKLAGQNLPNSSANGFELLDKDRGFGSSEFKEKALFQRALEGELARTITSIRDVESARVHLAIPKQSAFLRAQKNPSASVFVNLYAGRTLDEGQVAAVAHLVASSVPNLELEHVAVIDQKGRLLSAPDRNSQLGLSTSQFAFRKRMEDYLTERIESLITPVVGVGAVRAQVSAELDFTMTEQTQESFNPDLPAVRSEQTSEEQMNGKSAGEGGVPGALTNQPPATGADAAAAGGGASRSNKKATRNYELDRTISHVKQSPGAVRRLSVAVVVDDHQTKAEDGTAKRSPLTDEELGRITTLVKEAVGFDQRRGDSISVINASFNTPGPAEPLPPTPIFEQPWVWQAAKVLGGALVALFFYMMVLKPVMRSLAEKGAALPPPPMPELSQLTPEQVAALSGGNPQMLPASGYESNLNQARGMVQQDPRLVANVVRQWVGEDG